MQAQTELGTSEKLDVKEKTLKAEALKEVGVEVLRLRKQQCCLPTRHALGCLHLPAGCQDPFIGNSQSYIITALQTTKNSASASDT